MDVLRSICLWILDRVGLAKDLVYRALVLEVGLTGHVSVFDQELAKTNNYRSLNRFERWLLQPIMEFERKYRRELWRQSVLEVTGEDINADVT
jgi:hypothetical protein